MKYTLTNGQTRLEFRCDYCGVQHSMIITVNGGVLEIFQVEGTCIVFQEDVQQLNISNPNE